MALAADIFPGSGPCAGANAISGVRESEFRREYKWGSARATGGRYFIGELADDFEAEKHRYGQMTQKRAKRKPSLSLCTCETIKNTRLLGAEAIRI